MITDRNLEPHKEMKDTRNGDYVGNYKDIFSYYLNLFER